MICVFVPRPHILLRQPHCLLVGKPADFVIVVLTDHSNRVGMDQLLLQELLLVQDWEQEEHDEDEDDDDFGDLVRQRLGDV